MQKSSGLIEWFARNNVAANLLMYLIIFAGIFSAFSIKKEIFPPIKLNKARISVVYPGATSDQIEELVLIKIEESINQVSGIKSIESNAVYGSGSVLIDIDNDYVAQDVFDEIKLYVDSITTFPEEIRKPSLYLIKYEPTILSLALYGNADQKFLKNNAIKIRDDVRALPEVSKVVFRGMSDYEIFINLSEDKLVEFNTTFDQVAKVLKNNSVSLPGGLIKSSQGNIFLRVNNQSYTGKDFGKIPIKTLSDGSIVYLSDISTIVDGFKDEEVYSFFNRENAVMLDVVSVDGDDSLLISKSVSSYVKNKNLPENLSLKVWNNSSYYLQGRLDMMLSNMYSGIILVFIVLSFFLSFRLAFWVIVGLPVCFLGTLALMPLDYFGFSINVLTLFAFILVLGIVVDDAIIIGESAGSAIDKEGLSYNSVIKGVKKVAMPATFGVLTTIAAFMPMLLISGPMSIIWKSIAGVVILCLIFSLIESKLILPSHLVNMSPVSFKVPFLQFIYNAKISFNEKFNNFVSCHYRYILIKSIKNRYLVISLFLGGLIIIFGLIAGGKVRWVFFPDLPRDVISVSLEMDSSVNRRETYEAISNIEKALYEADKFFYEQDEKVLLYSFLNVTEENKAKMIVEFTRGEDRSVDTFAILSKWRELIPEIKDVKKFNINRKDGSKPIAFKVAGDNFDNLSSVSNLVKNKLESFSGVYDVNDNYVSGGDEISLQLNDEGNILGISLSSLARQVRNGFYGLEVQRVLRDREEIRVMLRYPKKERESIDYLKNMYIYTPSGSISLANIANLSIKDSSSNVSRVDFKRSIKIDADADKSLVQPGEIANIVMDYFASSVQQQYPDVNLSLYGDSKEEGSTVISLIQGAVLVLIVIYALLAIPLNSYLQPIIVMIAIPFSLIGAVIGHIILGISLNILSVMGIVALIGVVVNDSLIMVDCVNKNMLSNNVFKSVVNAGQSRFRAIVLTSLTTFSGILPILFEKSLQAQIVIPMATSLAFGIMFATLVTLILVPITYFVFHDIRRIFKSE